MKKILVTGANGQLGSELRELAIVHSPGFEWLFTDKSELDYLKLNTINDRLDFYNPDVIVNCAAYTAVDKAESEFELADLINHQAVEKIAKWVNLNSKKLIHISTDYVFDGQSRTPLMEDAEPSPINVYGKTKLMGEKACQKENPTSIVLRTSWVYSSFGSNFVKTMMHLMIERNQLKVVNDQVGSPTFAADLASAILSIIRSNDWYPGVYHYSNEGEITWFKFAQDIKELSGLNCELIPVDSNEYPTAARRPSFSLLNKQKIKSIFKVEVPDYKVSLRKHITQLIVNNQ